MGVLQRAVLDRHHSLFASCYRYPSPQCRSTLQLCSFFVWQPTRVMRCMHHAQAAPPPSCLTQAIIVCLWVTDDIYSPEIYFYHGVGRQIDICTIKRTIFQWSLCSTAMLLSESNIYLWGKHIFYVIWSERYSHFPRTPKIVSLYAVRALHNSHITPKAPESNDHSISILTECIRKD